MSDPVATSSGTHPLGVRVDLLIGSDLELQSGSDVAQLVTSDELVLRFEPAPTLPSERARNLQRAVLTLEAFVSEPEAKSAGQRLVLSLLWAAASKPFTVVFRVLEGAPPFEVYTRKGMRGFSSLAEGRANWKLTAAEVLGLMRPALDTRPQFSPQLLTSMEFFAAARMELTQRSRFIMVVTALEALCVQKVHGADVIEALNAAATQLPEFASSDVDGKALRNSLQGQIRSLRRESVRQALLRTLRSHGIDGARAAAIELAYERRSKLLHEGVRSNDLPEATQHVETVLREIYSRVLGLPIGE